MSEHARVIDELLKAMVERKASDLHLAVGSPPTYRIHGSLVPVEDAPLTPESLQEMVYAVLSAEAQKKFETQKELDFSYSLPGVSRYRGNALLQRGTMGAVFRAIPSRPPTLEEMGFPPIPQGALQKAARTRAGDRAHRFGEIDDAGGNDWAYQRQ